MAKIFPDLAGGYSGQVGKTLYYRVKKDCFAKTLPERTTPPTEAQSAQQLVFEMMGQLAGMTREVASHGFPKRSKKEKLWSASNVFMHENRGVCTVDDLASRTVTVDYPNLKCSKGSILMPEVTVTYSEENHSLQFTVAATEEFYQTCQPDDPVYAAVLDSNLMQCKLVDLGTRGDGGMKTSPLNRSWSRDALQVYAFATTADGKDASRTLYLPLE